MHNYRIRGRMLFPSLLLLFDLFGISEASVTASDLPDCAVECYCLAATQIGVPIVDYETQCRSAPFQITFRECAEKECNQEEYAFVH